MLASIDQSSACQKFMDERAFLPAIIKRLISWLNLYINSNDVAAQHSEMFDSHEDSEWLTKSSQSTTVSQLIVWVKWSSLLTKEG